MVEILSGIANMGCKSGLIVDKKTDIVSKIAMSVLKAELGKKPNVLLSHKILLGRR
mgnify:CR=1 FL=1